MPKPRYSILEDDRQDNHKPNVVVPVLIEISVRTIRQARPLKDGMRIIRSRQCDNDTIINELYHCHKYGDSPKNDALLLIAYLFCQFDANSAEDDIHHNDNDGNQIFLTYCNTSIAIILIAKVVFLENDFKAAGEFLAEALVMAKGPWWINARIFLVDTSEVLH